MNFDFQKRVKTKLEDSAIGGLLNKMTLESVFCTHSDFSSPWGIALPALDNCMMFHVVIEGAVQLSVASENVELQSGDFILLPRGEGHTLSDGCTSFYTQLQDLPIELVSERFERLKFGGQGDKSVLLCGAITFQHPLTLRLLGVLPDKIVIKAGSNSSKEVNTLTDLLRNETVKADMGANGTISRLADLLVITALREYLDVQKVGEFGWIGALENTRIAKAIQLVHESPSKHWSLEQLASEVGMSRTSFAVEFKKLVGNSPMDYLTEWRMSLAYSDLQNTKASILAIALDYGYQSESAFSRAFKKITGSSPGLIRKNNQYS